MNFDNGRCRCHGRLSPRRTPNGDVALITDELECIMQRVAVWYGTERGERPLCPTAGCCIREFFNKPMTRSNLLDLKAELKVELQDVFPEFDLIEVELEPLSRSEVKIYVNIGNYDIEFIGNPGDVNVAQRALRQALRDLGMETTT